MQEFKKNNLKCSGYRSFIYRKNYSILLNRKTKGSICNINDKEAVDLKNVILIFYFEKRSDII